jgi:hypothetical protein
LNLLKLLQLRKIKPITSSKNMFCIVDCRKMEYYDLTTGKTVNLSLSILMRKYYAIFGRVRGNILPLEALYRVVLEHIFVYFSVIETDTATSGLLSVICS